MTTLRMVDNSGEIVIHEVNQCSNCHTSLEDEMALKIATPDNNYMHRYIPMLNNIAVKSR